ncbi:hypothetical protein A3Q56_06756 [Intoshia linei]|uniref:Tetraspanin n=1 Tax=Intoshia linei TaxID=1819745 RepID=A0A177AVX0_9BILA|nr:hypothetical protein A3Q56_06756 [Intoshia linei]
MAEGKGIAVTVSQIIIIVINVLIGLIGLFALIMGILFVTNMSSMVMSNLLSEDQKANLIDSADSAGFDLNSMTKPLSIPLIIIGLILLITSLLGCCGICCKSKKLLFVYTIILSIVLLFQLILLLVVYFGALNSKMQSELTSTLTKYYTNSTSTTSFPTIVWNAVMIKFKCCGVHNYIDFESAEKFNKTIDTDAGTQKKNFPFVCCMHKKDLTCVTSKPDNTTSYANTGCWDKIYSNIQSYGYQGFGVAIAFLIIQFVIILICIYFMCRD